MQRLADRAPLALGVREIGHVDDLHPAELPCIRETQQRAVGEREERAGETVLRAARLAEQQLPGHAQRDDERLAAVELEDDELPAPTDTGDASSQQPRLEVP